jgi:formiminotetrahydrofolate cyclodeaminase
LNETQAASRLALAPLSIDELLERLSGSDPVPGGGSAAALAGAMGASLVSMVAGLTVGRDAYAEVEAEAGEIGEAASGLRDQLVALADEDSIAYQAYMEARRLPRQTDPERTVRARAMEGAIVQAADVPLRTARVARQALELARRIAPIGNRNAVSDAGVAALLTAAAVRGAILNVRINLPQLPEEASLRKEASPELTRIEEDAAALEAAALADVSERLA